MKAQKVTAEVRHGKRSTYQKGCRCDRCRTANTDYNRRVDRRLRGNEHLPYARPRVPIQPLIERVSAYLDLNMDQVNCFHIAEACGVSHRTVLRWMERGTLPAESTDEIATRLGWHPAVIWGLDWYLMEEAA